MKKKLILMCIAGALVMTGVIGGTLAGFNTSTDNKAVSNITVKTLGINILGTETEEQADNTASANVAAVPGGETLVQHNVKNDIADGYDLYTRVTIDKKWKNAKLDSSKIHLYVGQGDSKKELLSGETVNDWIVSYKDDEQVVMYYTKPLAAGETTPNMLDVVSFDTDMNNEYTDEQVELAFKADAVQAVAAEDSMPSEWGVYPVIDNNGTITAIEE